MKLGGKAEKELKLIAVDRAVEALEDDADGKMDEDNKKTDKKLVTCECPECGYEGPESQFKK
jgi:hypothetical protein